MRRGRSYGVEEVRTCNPRLRIPLIHYLLQLASCKLPPLFHQQGQFRRSSSASSMSCFSNTATSQRSPLLSSSAALHPDKFGRNNLCFAYKFVEAITRATAATVLSAAVSNRVSALATRHARGGVTSKARTAIPLSQSGACCRLDPEGQVGIRSSGGT